MVTAKWRNEIYYWVNMSKWLMNQLKCWQIKALTTKLRPSKSWKGATLSWKDIHRKEIHLLNSPMKLWTILLGAIIFLWIYRKVLSSCCLLTNMFRFWPRIQSRVQLQLSQSWVWTSAMRSITSATTRRLFYMHHKSLKAVKSAWSNSKGSWTSRWARSVTPKTPHGKESWASCTWVNLICIFKASKLKLVRMKSWIHSLTQSENTTSPKPSLKNTSAPVTNSSKNWWAKSAPPTPISRTRPTPQEKKRPCFLQAQTKRKRDK